MQKRIDTPQEVEDCKKLYFEQNGRSMDKIVERMKAKGWSNFHKHLLYPRRLKGGIEAGWPEKYGWAEEVKLNEYEHLSDVGHWRTRKFKRWLVEHFPDWRWSWKYQTHLYSRLHDVTSGRCKRLMIFLPPRHGKSELVTVRYAAWRMIEDAKLNVILGSYNQRLANRFSRKIQRIFLTQSREIAETQKESEKTRKGESETGTKSDLESEDRTTKKHETTRKREILKKQSLTQSVEEWETSGGGGLRAVGVGGGITGFGANLVVVDDPIKSRAEAESETFRENVWDWFNDDLYTRLEPNAAIILIQTRWHEDDLAGRLLREMEDGGEKWEVVSFPALAEGDAEIRGHGDAEREEESEKGRKRESEEENPQSAFRNPQSKNPPAAPTTPSAEDGCHPSSERRGAGGSDLDCLNRREGEALCPERFDRKALLRIKAKLGSYGFSALYQQNPIPAGGGAFKREWFRHIIDSAPVGLRWARGYDLAVSTKTSADFTASLRCAFDKAGNLYIADGFRKRIEYPEQRRYVVERMKEEKDTRHGIEAALHGQALVQDLRRDPSIRFRALSSVRVDGDKLTRALAWANLAEEGKVILVRGPWVADFLEEVCRFTGHNDRHDDQVDAVSLAVRLLSEKDKRLYGF